MFQGVLKTSLNLFIFRSVLDIWKGNIERISLKHSVEVTIPYPLTK